jgi:hypothetical protein
VSAYIVALYFFWQRTHCDARIGIRLLQRNTCGVGRLPGHGGTIVASLINHQHTFTLVFGSLAIGLAGYLALFYLTFF